MAPGSLFVTMNAWDRLIDAAVRLDSRGLADAVLVRRKLLHASQILAIWPLMRIDDRILMAALLGSCSIVTTTQRRLPYASLGLLTVMLAACRTAVGGAWVVLTSGDGVAGIAGRALHGPRLPWNQEKTWYGSLGFLAAATAALVWFLRRWCPALSGQRTLALAAATSLAAAAVESLAIPLDNNYSVPVVAGAILEAVLPPGCAGDGGASEKRSW